MHLDRRMSHLRCVACRLKYAVSVLTGNAVCKTAAASFAVQEMCKGCDDRGRCGA